MQKKYRHALSKHLPLDVKHILLNVHSDLFPLNDDKMLVATEVERSADDKFKTLLRDCTEVVYIPSSNNFYLPIPAERENENILEKIGTLYGCYLERAETAEVSESLARIRFEECVGACSRRRKQIELPWLR